MAKHIDQVINTTYLNNGLQVLAHAANYAWTGVNRSQAERKVVELEDCGISASVYQARTGNVYYIRIDSTEVAAV